MNATPSSSTPSESERIAQLEKKLQWAELRIQVLEEQLRLQRIKKYGAGSEKLNDAQLELLELEPGVSDAEVVAESQRPALPPPTTHAKRKHPGRQALPADLPRVEKVIACAPEQCTCAVCGQTKVVIGYEESEQLDVQPARYFVLVSKREKRACKACGEGGVAAVPAPVRIVEKGLVSDRVVIDTVISKYCDHLPLYRQSAILERETGVAISRATLDGWVMTVGGLLVPVIGAMRSELLAGGYIQADETPVGVQTHDRRGRNHQAYLWQYGKPGGGVVFDFQMSRGRDGPKRFLGSFAGLLQTDAYIAYEKVGGPQLVHAGCWTHARRGFFEAHQVSVGETVAKGIVELIDRLFAIDREARERNLDPAARHALRQQQAPELLKTIKESMQAARAQALPASKLGKAISYALGLWPRLERFLEYPELELSNNLAENSMRPVALGRKNWIHIGSPEAGPRVAAILSVVETCRRLAVPVREYLADVLPGLADISIHNLGQLTPAAWAARRNQ